MPPSEDNRSGYVKTMNKLLKLGGKLVGLWFDIPLIEGEMEKRPFGGDKDLYLSYLLPYFEVVTFEPSKNSIPVRSGNELFGIFKKK
jgi:thiopurine S-methyltransferase